VESLSVSAIAARRGNFLIDQIARRPNGTNHVARVVGKMPDMDEVRGLGKPGRMASAAILGAGWLDRLSRRSHGPARSIQEMSSARTLPRG